MLQKLQHNATWCNLICNILGGIKFIFMPSSFTCTSCWSGILSSFGRCRHTAGRSVLLPYGNKGYNFVETGTVLAARCILLILVASYRKLRWLLEQPDSSILPALPQWQWLLSVVEARTIEGIFGSQTHGKPCWL